MERYPCANQDTCRLRDTERGCFEDVHHLLYPRRSYRSPIEKEYRELDENKVRICRNLHNEIHATEPLPEKPSVQDMRNAVNESRIAAIAIREAS